MNKKETRLQKKARMFKTIETYHSSSQSQKNFCRNNDIKYSTFRFWLRQYQLRKDTDKTNIEQLSDQSFVPIEFSPSSDRVPGSQYGFTIEYPGGVRLMMNADPDIQLIRELLNLQAV